MKVLLILASFALFLVFGCWAIDFYFLWIKRPK